MRQLRDKYGPELEQRELQVLDSFLSDPDIIPAYKICKRMNRARQSLKRAEDPLPKITNSAHLLGDCLKDLRNGPLSDPDSSELTYLLSSLTLTHALVSHDRIATMDYFTPFPSPLYPSSGLTPLHSPEDCLRPFPEVSPVPVSWRGPTLESSGSIEPAPVLSLQPSS